VVAAVAVIALGINQAPAGPVAYYEVPRGAHPHDVAPRRTARSGTPRKVRARSASFDPKTGKVKQISLGQVRRRMVSSSAPIARPGSPKAGRTPIARFDPASKVVKCFPLPKEFPDANLNTATFDRKGILWFTGQNGVYGRVDPATAGRGLERRRRAPAAYGITTTLKRARSGYASLAGDPSRQDRHRGGDVAVVPPPPQGRRPGAASVGTPRGCCGWSFWNSGRSRPLRSHQQGLGKYERP